MLEFNVKLQFNREDITKTIEMLGKILDALPGSAVEVPPKNYGMMGHPTIAPGTSIDNNLTPPLTPDGQVDLELEIIDPPSINTGGRELDADGLPWDARINTAKKEKQPDGTTKIIHPKIKNGTWRVKKNLTPEFLDQIRSELRAVMGIPVPGQTAAAAFAEPAAQAAPAVPAAQAAPAVPAAQAAQAAPAVPAAQAAPAVPAAQAAPAVPAAQAAPAVPAAQVDNPVLAFTQKTTQRIAQKREFIDHLNATLAANGIPNLPALAARPDLVPGIDAALDAVWATL